MDFGLTDRVAFVAGASRGLGRAAARELADEGGRVALCSRNEDRIISAAEDIREETGAEVLPLVCDVTEEEQIEAAIAETVSTFGALHVLVTNAGGPPSGTATECAPTNYREAVELNLMSTIALCDAALPHLKTAAEDDDHARIVMVTSISAKQPIASLALSNTARAGVQGYAKSLATDLGPTGITVNTILPGYTRTKRLEELAADIREETGQSYAEIEAEWAEQNALPRIGEPEEFAATVAFLASKRAAYVTGVALPVDGGQSKHLL